MFDMFSSASLSWLARRPSTRGRHRGANGFAAIALPRLVLHFQDVVSENVWRCHPNPGKPDRQVSKTPTTDAPDHTHATPRTTLLLSRPTILAGCPPLGPVTLGTVNEP